MGDRCDGGVWAGVIVRLLPEPLPALLEQPAVQRSRVLPGRLRQLLLVERVVVSRAHELVDVGEGDERQPGAVSQDDAAGRACAGGGVAAAL